MRTMTIRAMSKADLEAKTAEVQSQLEPTERLKMVKGNSMFMVSTANGKGYSNAEIAGDAFLQIPMGAVLRTVEITKEPTTCEIEVEADTDKEASDDVRRTHRIRYAFGGEEFPLISEVEALQLPYTGLLGKRLGKYKVTYVMIGTGRIEYTKLPEEFTLYIESDEDRQKELEANASRRRGSGSATSSSNSPNDPWSRELYDYFP